MPKLIFEYSLKICPPIAFIVVMEVYLAIKSPGYSQNKRWDFDKVNTIIERADNILQERRQHLEQWMQRPLYNKRDSDQEVDVLFRGKVIILIMIPSK